MAAFSRDGKLVALGTADNTVHVWEVATGKERHTFAGLAVPMNKLSFDACGRYLAGGSFTGAVQVWDFQRTRPSAHGATSKVLTSSLTHRTASR